MVSKLDFWRVKPPSAADFEDQFLPGQPDTPMPSGGLPGDHRTPVDTSGCFSLSSYEAILYGMDFLKTECDQWFGTNRPASQIPKGIQDKLDSKGSMNPAERPIAKQLRTQDFDR